MKKLFVKTALRCLIIFALALMACAPALAVPSAEVTMSVSHVEEVDGGLIITVDIAVTAPSEPYASLDFNLITSNRGQLSIIDQNGGSGAAELAISFAPGYGGAYHAGRDDPETGGYRYLMGIFSRTAGNKITEATPVCSIRLRYSGDETQTLRLRNMKMVYIDGNGGVASAPVTTDDTVLPVDLSLLTEIGEVSVPLADSHGRAWVFGVVLFAMAALVCAIAVILISKFRRKSKSHI